MKMRALVCGLLLAAAVPAFAADVDGKWKGSIDMASTPVEVNFTFKADGAKLNGSTTGPDGKELVLKNGKVDGDKISFVLEVDMEGNLLTFNYTGSSPGADQAPHGFHGHADRLRRQEGNLTVHGQTPAPLKRARAVTRIAPCGTSDARGA